MFEGLGGRRTVGTKGRGLFVEPGGVVGQVAFSCPHLMYSSRREFVQAHEGMGCQPGGVRVVVGGRGGGGPVFEEEGLGSAPKGVVGAGHELGRRDVGVGGGGSVEDYREARKSFAQRDRKVPQGIHWEVLS